MSFTTDIKQEIAYRECEDCCKRAELSALLQLTSSLSFSSEGLHLIARHENPTCAKRIVFLLKKLYKAQIELSVVKKTNLRKNNIYTIEIFLDGKTLLNDLGLYSESRGLLSHPAYSIVVKNCCARSYLAGCFLAYGSCNSPNCKNYHLEFSTMDADHASFIVKLLSRFNITAKITERRGKQVVYVKKTDQISDFLRIVEATQCLYEFEDSRISRDLKHSIIRIDNCEIANEVKSLKAAENQLAMIRKIREAGKDKDMDEKLRNVMDLREKYQDYSLNELCDAYESRYGESLSKSGLKHRLNKIEAIASGL